MNYRERFERDDWKDIQQRSYERVKEELGFFGCEQCRRKFGKEIGGPDCHHKHYRNFGNEELDDIMVVCRDCHDDIEYQKECRTGKKRRNGIPTLAEVEYMIEHMFDRPKYNYPDTYTGFNPATFQKGCTIVPAPATPPR